MLRTSWIDQFIINRLTKVSINNKIPSIDNLTSYIGTHDGTFHCDEALAVGLLQYTNQYGGLPIVRSRNEEILAKCAILVDVGSVFDIKTARFDHHQRGFMETFNNKKKTKLSSAGLIYKYFGREILQNIINESKIFFEEKNLDLIYSKVYTCFIEHIDGIDNGIEASSGKKNYIISTNLSSRIQILNISWNEEYSKEKEMAYFKEAVETVLKEFYSYVYFTLTSWLPARKILENAVKNRFLIHESGNVIKLDRSCPWKSHIIDLEIEGFDGVNVGDIKFVLYPDEHFNWRIQCMTVDEHSFKNRLSIGHSNFHGLRGENLSSLWNIPGCIFIHASGFIGGNRTYDGALQMAHKSLNQLAS